MIRIRGPVLRVSWKVLLFVWTVHGLARTIWWLLRHPRTTATTAGCSTVVYLLRIHGTGWLAVAFFAVVVLLTVWAEVHPASFDRWVQWPAHAWWRRWTWYRRRWRRAMVAGELEHKGELPRLRRVRRTADGDEVRVQAPIGQKPQAWRDAAPFLAHIFGAASCEVFRGDDRGPTLLFRRAQG